MSDRVYRIIIGGLLLLFLYIDMPEGIYALIGLTLMEGITNLRLPTIYSMATGHIHNPSDDTVNLAPISSKRTIQFEAERMWRLNFAAFIAISFIIEPKLLWFIPWFMGFAILGAGVSGVCPMLLGIKWIGFVDAVRPNRKIHNN